MENFKTNFNFITNIIILTVLVLGGTIWADSNGVWIKASDVQGGTFGSDEGNPDFIFPGEINYNGQSLDSRFINSNGDTMVGNFQVYGDVSFRENLPNNWIYFNFDGAGSTKSLGIHYGGDATNTLRFARRGDNIGAWEANVISFDMDADDSSLVVANDGRVYGSRQTLATDNGLTLTTKGYVDSSDNQDLANVIAVGNKWGTDSFLRTDQGGSIDLGGSGNPYIDFKNAVENYDMRIQLNGNDALNVKGGILQVQGQEVATKNYVETSLRPKLFQNNGNYIVPSGITRLSVTAIGGGESGQAGGDGGTCGRGTHNPGSSTKVGSYLEIPGGGGSYIGKIDNSPVKFVNFAPRNSGYGGNPAPGGEGATPAVLGAGGTNTNKCIRGGAPWAVGCEGSNGGGGAGGTGQDWASGSGGASGYYISDYIISVSPGQTISIQLGAGGALSTNGCRGDGAPGGKGAVLIKPISN